jgi:pyruvate,water dikinase
MHTGSDGAAMSVVVQRMVDARCAGVVFTADPVTARRDRMVVEAVEGTGSALVGGKVTPDHFALARDGSPVKSELAGSDPCVQHEELLALASDALRIERHFGLPVECEWAIDREGRIAWLQARPITTLPADPRELDTELNPDDVYTHCSIGEMMPGVVTPLTWSTSAHGLDQGMQRMYMRISSLEKLTEEPSLVCQWFGHLFFNLSQQADMARSIAGESEADVVEAICGRPVPEIVPGQRPPLWVRLLNALRCGSFALFSGRHIAVSERLIASIDLTPGADAHATYAIIDRELPKLNEAWFQHTGALMIGGALASALPRILAKGGQPTERHNAEVAELLAGAGDVESYDIAAGIDHIVAALVEHDGPKLNRLLALDAQAADRFLWNEASSPARNEYSAYLERYGHRCVSELEMREKEWAEDPTPIVEAVLSGVRAVRAGHVAPKVERSPNPPTLALLVRFARHSVRNREKSKSQVITVITLFKRAYRTLARQMVAEGLLLDGDVVFFLQHAELGKLLRDRDPKLAERALARREALPFQMKLIFPEIFRGKAEPVDPPLPSGESVLHGKTVSCGVVRGRARVALTRASAGEVQPDEILIAPIVDVGWTPSFATIAGFASDIGSAISHGAVVAREYGLPMLVNLHQATTTFRTGDLVELDADHGTLRRIPED